MMDTMSLKLKILIYRYFGLYLATREELDYITSRDFWKEWAKMDEHTDNDMTPRDIQGLLIGMWQAKYGFARPMSRFWGKKQRWNNVLWPFWKTLDWFVTLGTVIKWDLEKLFRRKSK